VQFFEASTRGFYWPSLTSFNFFKFFISVNTPFACSCGEIMNDYNTLLNHQMRVHGEQLKELLKAQHRIAFGPAELPTIYKEMRLTHYIKMCNKCNILYSNQAESHSCVIRQPKVKQNVPRLRTKEQNKLYYDRAHAKRKAAGIKRPHNKEKRKLYNDQANAKRKAAGIKKPQNKEKNKLYRDRANAKVKAANAKVKAAIAATTEQK
jgi:hypothetical protein